MKNKERRNFLQKMALGLGSLFTLSSVTPNPKIKNTMAIKSIKALGFQWETTDPFLFCAHHEDKYPKGNKDMGPACSLEGRHIGQDFIVKDGWRMYHGEKIPGFPGHPHRGFETITVVRKGIVDHADSLGGAGRYGNGDVQWMTAGKGLQHSEMFPLLNENEANPLELFQIWLNLPRKSKMVAPEYKMLWSETIPKIEIKNNGGDVEIIAGTLNDTKAPSPAKNSWAAIKENNVGVFNIRLEPGAFFDLEACSLEANRTLYYYQGNGLKIEGQEIPNYHAVEVDPNQILRLKNGLEESKILVLQGKPIDEPVVQHGPFVMNSREEIRAAFEDYQKDHFGGWPWKNLGQVHSKEKKRFALHADGTEEVKG